MIVEKLSTTLLLPAELAETGNAYKKAIKKSALENPFILGVLALLTKDLKGLNLALAAIRINELIDEVAELDALRDDLYISFRDLVASFRRRRKPELVAAYEKIWPHIEKAGTTLYNLGYTEQSGKMEALFAELDKPKNQEALIMLTAAAIYESLKNIQEEFSTLYSTRLDLDAQNDYLTLKEAKKPTTKHINFLLDAIEHLDEMEPNKHEKLIRKLNEITSAIMATARARKTRKENESEGSEEKITE